MSGRALRRHGPAVVAACTLVAGLGPRRAAPQAPAPPIPAAAVIQHVVVIFQENVSFDHYFATYPHAANLPGERPFTPLPDTPAVAGLSGDLLTRNPNALNPLNGEDAVNPYRLPPSQAATADQDHSYTQEQLAFDHGKMDLFPGSVGHGDKPQGSRALQAKRSLNLAYFDGNTVTAMWNYAQRFAMSDHFFQATFGPSTLGHLNLIAGQTNGVAAVKNGASPNVLIEGGGGSYTILGDVDPIGDICSSSKRIQVTMASRNIGDLLDQAGVTWGWFQGGFDVTATNPNGTTGCDRSHTSRVTGLLVERLHPAPRAVPVLPVDRQPEAPPADVGRGHRHERRSRRTISTILPTSTRRSTPATSRRSCSSSRPPIRTATPDTPIRSTSRRFVVQVLNDLQQRPEWKNTAVLLTWDDSDGWYDHLMGPIVNSSVGPVDALDADGLCGDGTGDSAGISPAPPTTHALGRCGYGPRLPLLVMSPWARRNYVDSTVTDMTSIARFIEDVFLDGRRLGGGSFDAIAGSLMGLLDLTHGPDAAPLLLDEQTGAPLRNGGRP